MHAVVFTNAEQVRNLFAVAEKLDKARALQKSLNRTLVASIGPVASAALRESKSRSAWSQARPSWEPSCPHSIGLVMKSSSWSCCPVCALQAIAQTLSVAADPPGGRLRARRRGRHRGARLPGAARQARSASRSWWRTGPGAGSSIAAEHVAKSAPDGYTVLIASPSSILVNPLITPKAGFQPLEGPGADQQGELLAAHPRGQSRRSA